MSGFWHKINLRNLWPQALWRKVTLLIYKTFLKIIIDKVGPFIKWLNRWTPLSDLWLLILTSWSRKPLQCTTAPFNRGQFFKIRWLCKVKDGWTRPQHDIWQFSSIEAACCSNEAHHFADIRCGFEIGSAMTAIVKVWNKFDWILSMVSRSFYVLISNAAFLIDPFRIWQAESRDIYRWKQYVKMQQWKYATADLNSIEKEVEMRRQMHNLRVHCIDKQNAGMQRWSKASLWS